MPTQQTTYNSRVTSESLEKKFRDTFTAQGGAELVDDLYASGVVVPIVDFTAAAEGSALRSDLQTAWDFATNIVQITSTSDTTIVTTPGFWKVDIIYNGFSHSTSATRSRARVKIDTGAGSQKIWEYANAINQSVNLESVIEETFTVFLRSGDTLEGNVQTTDYVMFVRARQIADVSGNLVNPLGFTSS